MSGAIGWLKSIPGKGASRVRTVFTVRCIAIAAPSGIVWVGGVKRLSVMICATHRSSDVIDASAVLAQFALFRKKKAVKGERPEKSVFSRPDNPSIIGAKCLNFNSHLARLARTFYNMVKLQSS